MHDTFLVKLSNGNNYLCCVELDHCLVEALLLLEDFVKLATIDKRHDEVETSLRLEEPFHTAEEWVICLEENVFLKCS